jgi:ATP-binding cassette subfamily B protein
MGFVLQESILFNTTIRENIRLGRPEAVDLEVEVAAKDAELHDAISRLPDGYETVVGDRGSRLSGGQLQRVAIARALIRNPDILLLDEATSALDPAAVNETLLRAARGRTTIAVTHRLASITQANRIFVLQHGQVVEHGSHQDLLGGNGVYAGLWRKQNGFVISPDGAVAEISGDRLREIDLLRPLSPSQLEALASRFVCERVSAGQVIFREEDPSELFYVIARGRVAVTRRGRSEGDEVIKVADMSVGDEFGEMGLLNDSPRNATVTAKTDCLLLTLTRNHFFDLLKDSPEVRAQIEAILAARTRSKTV